MEQLRLDANQPKNQTVLSEYTPPNDEIITKMVQAVCRNQVANENKILSDEEVTEFSDFLKSLMDVYAKHLNNQKAATKL